MAKWYAYLLFIYTAKILMPPKEVQEKKNAARERRGEL